MFQLKMIFGVERSVISR